MKSAEWKPQKNVPLNVMIPDYTVGRESCSPMADQTAKIIVHPKDACAGVCKKTKKEFVKKLLFVFTICTDQTLKVRDKRTS